MLIPSNTNLSCKTLAPSWQEIWIYICFKSPFFSSLHIGCCFIFYLSTVFVNIQTNKIPLHNYTALLVVNATVNNHYSKQLAAIPEIPPWFCCCLFLFQRLFLFSHYFIWWVVFAAEGEASRVGSSHIMDIKEDPKKGSVCSRCRLLTQLFW